MPSLIRDTRSEVDQGPSGVENRGGYGPSGAAINRTARASSAMHGPLKSALDPLAGYGSVGQLATSNV